MRHPSLVPLSHDHHHGLALALRCRKQALGQIKPMGAAGLRERADEVSSFYVSNLLAHFRVEEEVLFPGLRSMSPRSESMITELIDDHRAIGLLVEQLRNASGLAKVIFDLGDLLERHIRMEERELFPIFEQEIDAAQAEAIGSEMQRRFEAGQHR
jgi:iron-sulfur cluster repair protein YtfE (RIC family)